MLSKNKFVEIDTHTHVCASMSECQFLISFGRRTQSWTTGFCVNCYILYRLRAFFSASRLFFSSLLIFYSNNFYYLLHIDLVFVRCASKMKTKTKGKVGACFEVCHLQWNTIACHMETVSLTKIQKNRFISLHIMPGTHLCKMMNDYKW